LRIGHAALKLEEGGLNGVLSCRFARRFGLIQYFKTLLVKMPVESKNVFQPKMPHGDKADAIDEA
jgi:hypothetical protein